MLTFYHAPNSRSLSTLWLLEELGVPYETEIVDIRTEGGAPESYRAIHPHKKVPAIVHDGVTVTERAAITIHLADAFPKAGLAPAIGDKRRGPYLTSIVYVEAVLDPLITAKVTGQSYDPRAVSFGSFEDGLGNLERTLSAQPYAVGDSFTAADTQFAGAVHYGMNVLKVFPEKPVFRDYLGRIAERPAFRRTIAG